MKTRRATILIAAAALVFPASAQATTLSDSITAARAYWGQDATCLDIRFAPGKQVFLARAELGADLDGDGDLEQGCVLILSARWFKVWPRLACESLAHEWGHLLGHGHSHDGGLMDQFRVRSGLVPQCRGAGRVVKGLPFEPLRVKRSRALARKLGWRAAARL